MELLHKLWLDLTNRGLGHKLHHRDVVRVALRQLESALASGKAEGIVDELKKETEAHKVKQPDWFRNKSERDRQIINH